MVKRICHINKGFHLSGYLSNTNIICCSCDSYAVTVGGGGERNMGNGRSGGTVTVENGGLGTIIMVIAK